MTNLPVFFTSVAARAAKLSSTLEHSAGFISTSSAIDFTMSVFVIAFTVFIAFIVFMGA